jgi:peroxiredoxin
VSPGLLVKTGGVIVEHDGLTIAEGGMTIELGSVELCVATDEALCLAVVNDGTVEWIAVEGPRVENSGPDPFEVSSAEAMLSYLTTAPAAKKAK